MHHERYLCTYCDAAVDRLAGWKVCLTNIIIEHHRKEHLKKITKGDDIRWNHCELSPCKQIKEMFKLDIHKLRSDYVGK